jgi:pimeloyl-ACP methyl ester carboxylesterase
MTHATALSATATCEDEELQPVVLIPGGVNPAAISYGPLLEVIKDDTQVVLKDLEVYASDVPPPNYSLDLEAEGIRRAADAAGMDRFHLVGYSGGGACCLMFISRYPERVLSLALIEPAWIGTGEWTPEEQEYWAELSRVMALPVEERMAAFVHANSREATEPPSPAPDPPPAWMAKRPAGVEAMLRAFEASDLQRASFRCFKPPVYLAVGGQSHPYELYKAQVLAGLFPNITGEVYEARTHWDPPHRAEPERFARALRRLWARAEGRATAASTRSTVS